MQNFDWDKTFLGEADFDQFLRQRNQLVVAADNFLREQNFFYTVLQSTLSKDVEEQLKSVYKVIDVVGRPNRRICVTLLPYKLDNPETSSAQVRLFGRKKEEEKFQQIVYVNSKLDDFVYLHHFKNSLYDKVIANEPICNVLEKVIATIYSYHLIFFFQLRMRRNIGDKRNFFCKLKTKVGLYHVELRIETKDSSKKLR